MLICCLRFQTYCDPCGDSVVLDLRNTLDCVDFHVEKISNMNQRKTICVFIMDVLNI